MRRLEGKMFNRLMQVGVLLVSLLGLDFAVAQDCSRSCEPSCIREARETLRDAEEYLRYCGASPNPGPGPRPGVEIYDTDNCSSGLVAIVGRNTDCFNLRGQRAWGVRINNVCENIQDTRADIACEVFKDGVNSRGTALYRSDSCREDLIAIVDRNTDCNRLATLVAGPVWGIKKDGRCQDISDMPVLTACRSFAGK
jgi:hypothetical protein